MSSTFFLKIAVPRFVRFEGKTWDREAFYAWLWREFERLGFLGVHEGTLLTEDAAREGLETESWTIDAAQAPRERDWVSGKSSTESVLYFSTRGSADKAWKRLEAVEGLVLVQPPSEQPAQDWDAEWKASYRGVRVPPFWNIVPPWLAKSLESPNAETMAAGVAERMLVLNPGAGFGTGTHETTQLCLGALGRLVPPPRRVLDFGSGSGILAIGAALLGAEVDGVEIDPLAIDNAEANAALNGVEGKIRFSRDLGKARNDYDVVMANILRPVLLQFAPELVSRLRPGGAIILSGLMESDVPQVEERYLSLLRGRFGESVRAVRREQGEWRALEIGPLADR